MILWRWKNFWISECTRISLDHSKKMRMHKIKLRRMFIHSIDLNFLILSNQNPIKNHTFIVFFQKWIWFYLTIYIGVFIITSHMYIQFVRVYVIANSLNALITCYGHQQLYIKTFKRTFNSWQLISSL